MAIGAQHFVALPMLAVRLLLLSASASGYSSPMLSTRPVLASRPHRVPDLRLEAPKREYLLGPVATEGSTAWIEKLPGKEMSRLCIVATEPPMTDLAIDNFLVFLDEALALEEPFTVLWDIGTPGCAFPSMRQFYKVMGWMNSGDHAVEWDKRVKGHGLVVSSKILRGAIRVMASIARAPQPVSVVSARGDVYEFLEGLEQGDKKSPPPSASAAPPPTPSSPPPPSPSPPPQPAAPIGEVVAAPQVAASATATMERAPAAPPPRLREALPIRIDDQWYDLRAWRAAHPAGPHWLDGFAHQDATDVMHAFHSDEAVAMMTRLPKLSASVAPPSLPPTSELTIGFRALRAKLIADGWYKRVWWREAANLAPCLGCYAVGTFVARTMPLLGTILLALGSTAAGWIAHDFIHGRGAFCSAMRGFGSLMNGHSASWWSNKHNLHHACTNQVGVDEDIMSDPFFFLWAPDPARDSRMRKLQHLYALPVYSILFALWRFNSVKTVAAKKLYGQAGCMALNYAWMAFCLPPMVAIGHVFLAGVMTATIVTVSHQAEDLYHEHQHDWVGAQIGSTRDAVTSNPFSEWLWGGMQYQLEHHLFPTMPRYRYPALVPLVKELCAANNVEYRVDGELDVVKRNFALLRDVAYAPAEVGSPATRTETVWSNREGAAWVGSN